MTQVLIALRGSTTLLTAVLRILYQFLVGRGFLVVQTFVHEKAEVLIVQIGFAILIVFDGCFSHGKSPVELKK